MTQDFFTRRIKEQKEYICQVMNRALRNEITIDRSLELIRSAFEVMDNLKTQLSNLQK